MPRASLAHLTYVEAHGYRVERWGDHGWTLIDVDGGGAQLQIEGHGGIAPRQVDAVGEAMRRIAADEQTRARAREQS